VSDLELTVSISGDRTATFGWSGSASPEALERAVRVAAEDILVGEGLRRIEISVPAGEPGARRAVLRAGFRLEGVRRQVLEMSDGSYADLCLFARLASDEVGGSHGFSSVMNSALPKKRLIAHVLMRDVQDRVLLCETQFKEDWELPGGIVEPLEPPRLGAAREVRAIEMIFDGGVVAEGDLAYWSLQPTEIKAVALTDLSTASQLLTPLAFRRLSLAVGLGPDEMAYTEDGRTV
jgi:hypothetical protein